MTKYQLQIALLQARYGLSETMAQALAALIWGAM